jgi:hypothetical protein
VIRRLLLALIGLTVTVFGVSACGSDTSGSTDTIDQPQNNSGGGLVLTPRGGIGVDLGGGLHLDPSTGGIGIGGIPLS